MIEEKMAKLLPPYQIANIAIADLQQSIPENTVILDFAGYVNVGDKKMRMAMFVIDNGTVELFDLGEGINELALELNVAVRKQAKEVKKKSQELSRRIFSDEIAKKLAPYETLWISPDVALHYLPFACLYWQNDYLVKSKNLSLFADVMSVINSSHNNLSVAQPSFLLFGNVKFANSKYNMNNQELAKIKKSLDENTLYNTQAFFAKEQASETNFKQHHQGKTWVHIDSHGKWFQNERENVLDKLTDVSMLFSEYGGESSKEDGLLTALEVSGMNLGSVYCTVLSCCETGLGDLTSEGIFGFKWALQKAGVQNTVLTLYPVSIDHTSRFMDKLYSKVAEGGQISVSQIINQVQREMCDNSHPYYWAGFVCNGVSGITLPKKKQQQNEVPATNYVEITTYNNPDTTSELYINGEKYKKQSRWLSVNGSSAEVTIKLKHELAVLVDHNGNISHKVFAAGEQKSVVVKDTCYIVIARKEHGGELANIAKNLIPRSSQQNHNEMILAQGLKNSGQEKGVGLAVPDKINYAYYKVKVR